MKLSLVLLLGILKAAFAFQHLQREGQVRERMQAMRNENDPHDIVASSTFRDIDIDMDRVKDCAEHFGKCSMKELKQLKGDLHDKRIQNLAFGDHKAPEDMFEDKVFEEELALQLNLLHEDTPPSYLFPEVEDEMEALPHLKDGTVAAKVKRGLEQERKVMMVEELAEEGVLESLAICALLGVMMLAPQFIGA